MSVGSITFDVTNLLGDAITGRLRIDFDPEKGTHGGTPMKVEFDVNGHETFTVSGISCHDGLGSLYRVTLTTDAFKPYAYFQRIDPGNANRPSESPIRLVIDPSAVTDIKGPAFGDLPPSFRRGLDDAKMIALLPGDKDLVDLTGAELYDALGPMRQACLLNLVAKATHASSDRVSRFILAPTVMRQDRCFANVKPETLNFLSDSSLFKTAPSLLHPPPAGFERLQSFKTKDAHANLQMTLMREIATGALLADVDIDEASGIEHGFEVIRNTVGKGKTNPFLVRELLLLADPKAPIDPGYDFVL